MMRKIFIDYSLAMLVVISLSGCGSPPPLVIPLVPLSPEVQRLAPDISLAAHDNDQAQAAIGKLTTANMRVIKPAVTHVLTRQKQTLASAAAQVALLEAGAKRSDAAAVSLVQRQQQLTGALAVAQSQAAAARNRYESAWLGGKAHRLLEWIVGIGIVLLIVDFLASSFLGVGLNPFEWLAGLGRAAQAKHA
ncbi:MAG: hypothetical protein HKL96_13065 [Phycisphaerales bacterium]|nr:hypothetical protein [Phycisphaerales bacterium]